MAHPPDSTNPRDHSSRKAPVELRTGSKRIANRLQRSARSLIRITEKALSRICALTKEAKLFIKDFFTSQHPEIKKLDIPKLSPVLHLLKSNIPPTSSEIDVIHHAIFQANQRREQFLLDTTLHPTIRNRQLDRTETFICQHHAILSPVRLLPPEVLQTIFLCLLSERPPSLKQDPRWTFAQVSCIWRGVALSLTYQWGILPVVDLTSTAHQNVKSSLNILAEYVRRSAPTPLTVTVIDCYEDDANTIDAIDNSKHPLLMFLASLSWKWKKLSLTTTPIKMAKLDAISGNLPVLEALELVMVVCPSLQDIRVFERAPKLRKAVIRCTVAFSGHLHLPYFQLTKLQTNIPEHIVADLSLASGQFLGVPSASLPLLTVLRLHFVNIIYQNLLSALNLPALEEVFISHCNISVCRTLMSIFTRSKGPCRLRTIYIRFGSSSHRETCGDLPSLLSLAESLDTLDVEILYPEDLLSLSSVLPGRILVPRLTRCTLCISDVMPEDHTMRRAVSDFVLSRCQPLNNAYSSYGQVRMLSLCTGNPTHLRSRGLDQLREPNLQQALFEEWNRWDINVETKFEEYKWSILSNLPHFLNDNEESLVMRRYTQITKPEWRKATMDILVEIALSEVVNAMDIVRSNFHHCLNQLKTLFLTDPVAFSRHLALISKIYEIWEESFEDISDNLHWAFEKETFEAHVLIYIPKNHPIRLLKRATTSLFMQGYCKADAPDLLDDLYLPD